MGKSSRSKAPPVPSERGETLRQSLLKELGPVHATARELGAAVGLREKEVLAHLESLARTLASRGESLEVTPAACMNCEYVFRDREAFAKPGRCPSCKGERVEPPRFGRARKD